MSSVLLRVASLWWISAGRCNAVKVYQGQRPSIPSVTAASGPYWQELRNSLDLQYFGDIKVGEQTIAGVFDTGSFELLVFGEQCQTCGKAIGYHHSHSQTFFLGNHTETHSFGSGTCQSQDAFERVQVGPFDAQRFPFWEVVLAQMPVLRQANFQSIVGIGPPGEPVASATAAVEDADQEAAEYQKAYGYIPKRILEQRKDLLEKVELAKSKTSLLETLGVKTFSVCLGRAPGSSGWLVWNDDSSRSLPTFQHFPVAGTITWSLQVTSVSFQGWKGGAQPLGCQEGGCGAIIDTGTSLLALPTKMYRKIYDLLQTMGQDCSDLSKFPDLTLTVGGQELRFGPDSYIGVMTGQADSAVEKYIHMEDHIHHNEDDLPIEGQRGLVQLRQNRTNARPVVRKRGQGKRRAQCQLLLMDLGDEVTQLGPLMILGMPFFREYYTTFELDSTDGKRRLAVAHADEQCRPRSAASLRARRLEPRRVDVSGLRAPRLPRRAGNGSAARVLDV